MRGVIDAAYTGEIKVALLNLGTESYKMNKEAKIAQLIVEKIASEEAIRVEKPETIKRGRKGFGSNDRNQIKQVRTGADLLTKSPTVTILVYPADTCSQ